MFAERDESICGMLLLVLLLLQAAALHHLAHLACLKLYRKLRDGSGLMVILRGDGLRRVVSGRSDVFVQANGRGEGIVRELVFHVH